MMLVSAVQSSTDLVVLQSDALCVKEDGVASVAMQHLQMLGLQLTNTLAGCTNQKVLECKVKYEQKVKTLLAFSSEELGKQNIAKCKQELLRDEIFDQMKERMEREQKHVSIQKMQQVIIETFQTEIDRINSTFPDQLKSYIDQTGKQLAEALSEKEKMCREQSEFFLQKLSAMEEFLNKTSKAIPSYSLYGESCHLMLRQANDFSERKEDLINQLRSLVKPEGLLNEIQKKIEEVSAKILLNKDKALSHLHEEIDKLSKGKSKDSKLKQIEGYIDILQEANSIYVEQTDHYLDLVSHSVNELVAGVQAEMTLALKLQDENLIQLTTKSQALSGFLEYQTKKVLELVQEHQKPIISREVGAALGRLFDDRSDVAHGRIAKINIWSNYFINKLEVIYEDATGRQTVGMQGGVTKAELEDRFVHRFVTGDGALSWLGFLGLDVKGIHLGFLEFLLFISVIAGFTQILEIIIEKVSPALYMSLGLYLPLIAVNCAILGACLFAVTRDYPFIPNFIYVLGSALGWWLAIALIASIRERLSTANVVPALKGMGITFIMSGLMSMAFMGFTGIKLANPTLTIAEEKQMLKETEKDENQASQEK